VGQTTAPAPTRLGILGYGRKGWKGLLRPGAYSPMTEANLEIGKFSQVDDSGMDGLLLAFLDFFEKVPGILEMRQRSYQLLGDVTAKTVIDLGCGTGTAVAELAALGARACGVDASEHLLSVAKGRHHGSDFRLARLEELPFNDGSVDLLRAERVFQHLSDPAVALGEAHRILAPGGRIVLIDFDVQMWIADAADTDVMQDLTLGFAATLASPWIGRHYRSALLDAGFEEVVVDLRPLTFTRFEDVAPLIQSMALVSVAGGFCPAERVDEWMKDQQERSARDRMFMAVVMFVGSGQKRS
jgi:ubiquinone/menaquinone biosynthesis C-methylase UbiE